MRHDRAPSQASAPNPSAPMPNSPGAGELAAGTLGSRLLMLSEVAAYFRVHPKTVQKWIAQDGFPCIRVGKRPRFDPTDISRWVSARKEG